MPSYWGVVCQYFFLSQANIFVEIYWTRNSVPVKIWPFLKKELQTERRFMKTSIGVCCPAGMFGESGLSEKNSHALQ
jgi:hypothetical protein